MRPVIGITSYAEEARFGAWTLPAALVPLAYVSSVEIAGGRPVVLPPTPHGVDETLDALDGLVVSGGPDLDPALYGAEPHEETRVTRPERDAAELALLAEALRRDLPVLAICRGSQLLNVLRGGDLVQHVPELVGSDVHRERAGAFSQHEVAVEEGTRLAGVVGSEVRVHSSHHQGFGRIGEGLRVAAHAPDGTVEALEDPVGTFALGVLWHPEEDGDSPLFAALVREAVAYRTRCAASARSSRPA